MTVSTALIMLIRAHYKQALDLILAGKKTEAEARSMLEFLQNFTCTGEPIELTHTVNPGPGFHIQVEPERETRRKSTGSTDVTEVIDLPAETAKPSR